jgi:alpha-L-rhamnosidase
MNSSRFFLALGLALSTSSSIRAKVTCTHLRCEYLTDPLAVDAERPRLSWVIESDERDVHQNLYRILVAGSAAALSEDRGDLWDSRRVRSADSNQVEYDGKPLASGQEVFWKVQVWTRGNKACEFSEPASWRMGVLKAADWKAKWIAAPGDLPTGDPSPALPSPMLRKEFQLKKPLRRAIATVSALGLYEVRLNGKRVGDQLLTPNWTDYKKRVQYQAYDVTDLLKEGPNAAGAVLGDGWYAGRIGISHIVPDGALRNFYGRKLWLLFQLDLEYADSSRETIASDASWRATTDGPIRSADLLDGEEVDARKEMAGWDAPRFDDAAWKPVETQDSVAAALVAQPNEPIRVTEELKPVSRTEPRPGVYVFDLGQNLAGWCRLRARGPAGTTITLRHAEVLQTDGNIYRDNLRMSVYEKDTNLKLGKYLGARQEDRFILRGGDEEVLEPHFTYHGFRYVEVTGFPGEPSPDAIIARAFHSAPAFTGSFECSNPLLNRLMKNIVWTQRDNLHSVPTDCPQRDERMGWMGDMLVFAQAASFNMDMAAFFTKWVQDIRDAQAGDGRYPDFAPHPFGPDQRFSGVPAWGDAGVFVPWAVYVNYGDRRILEKHFDSARRWVDWIDAQNPDHLWRQKRNNDYGDWLNGDTLKLAGFGYPEGGSEVPKDVFATGFFQRSAQLVAKMAEAIGRKEESRRYRQLAYDIRRAFRRAYVTDDGEVKGNTQSGYALALAFDLLPEGQRGLAAYRMRERIEAYKGHISTGFHTTVMLMNELTRNGSDDIAYQLIQNRTIPSWGYTIDHGATTVWERWDGYVEGRGYQDPGMNSFNHYAIGSVGEWMVRSILGINPDEERPGYEQFTIRPRPGGGLEWAKGSYDSIRGKISVEWKYVDGELDLAVAIPANTIARVYVPWPEAGDIAEGGIPAARSDGVTLLRSENGETVFQVGSGSYRFSAPR